MAEVTTALPIRPFDGQEFIDSFRIKWVFSAANDCWRRLGTVPNLPVATELQPGLLTSRLKALLDSIPEHGGHFGIVAKPLLRLANTDAPPILVGKTKQAFKNESGTQIIITSDQPMVVDQFAGKGVLFKSGILQGHIYLIFTNSQTDLFIEGDASQAKLNDDIQIVDPKDLNPSGVILGDIMLVSDSIDISCIDSHSAPIQDKICGDKAQPDGSLQGLDFKLNQNFIDQFCLVIPGCKGPRGDQGGKGLAGKDGAGDGPTGETGNAGVDASPTPNTFTGIKVVDINDIFDMAVVGIELDAPNNRLNLIKAKVRTPSSDTPADQVITSPIIRNIAFTDAGTFAFSITMPDVDPIGTADINILKYPEGFFNSSGTRGGATSPVQPQNVKLSALINEVANFWDNKLREINDQYNKTLKAYIEEKDAAARTILADMAQKVAECEFQMPIEFCIGIHPDQCHNPINSNTTPPASGFSFPLATTVFGPTFMTPPGTPGTPTIPGIPSTPTAFDLGTYTLEPTTTNTPSNNVVRVMWPDKDSSIASATLPPAGYIVQYESGSVKSSETDWLVGSAVEGVGLEVQFIAENGSSGVRKMPVPSQIFNPKEQLSVAQAYKNATLFEKIVSITLPAPGSINIKVCLPGVDAQGAISVKVLAVFNGAPPLG